MVSEEENSIIVRVKLSEGGIHIPRAYGERPNPIEIIPTNNISINIPSDDSIVAEASVTKTIFNTDEYHNKDRYLEYLIVNKLEPKPEMDAPEAIKIPSKLTSPSEEVTKNNRKRNSIKSGKYPKTSYRNESWQEKVDTLSGQHGGNSIRCSNCGKVVSPNSLSNGICRYCSGSQY